MVKLYQAGYLKIRELCEKYLFADSVILPKKRLSYASDCLWTFHAASFLEDDHFLKSYELGKKADNKHLLRNVDIQWRIHTLCWAATHAAQLEGDFVDCGVNYGIFANAVAHFIHFEQTNKTYYLLDTFYGLDGQYCTPEELQRNDHMKYGKVPPETIKRALQESMSAYQIKIIEGAVPKTLPEVDAEQIAYLSLDMNCAEPEVEALEYFWDRIVPGGIVVFDDYAYTDFTRNQRVAHDCFASSKGLKILNLPTCQGVLIKPA